MPFSVFTGSDQHVINTVFGLKQERVAEVILIIAVSISFQVKSTVFSPCFEVRRSSYHHDLCILVGRGFELIAGIECVIEFISRIVDCTSCTDCRILFIAGSAGNQFAKGFISGTVFGCHPENGVVSSFRVRTVILQIHHFKILGNRIIKWHRVTDKAYLRFVIHGEAMFVGRLEISGCTIPVFLGQYGIHLITAGGH